MCEEPGSGHKDIARILKRRYQRPCFLIIDTAQDRRKKVVPKSNVIRPLVPQVDSLRFSDNGITCIGKADEFVGDHFYQPKTNPLIPFSGPKPAIPVSGRRFDAAAQQNAGYPPRFLLNMKII